MSPRNLRSALSFALLLLVLAFAALPAEALPGRRLAVAEDGKGSGVLSVLQALFASLWPGDGVQEKEGMSIDPDGTPRPTVAPGGDEGMSIDPNGGKP